MAQEHGRLLSSQEANEKFGPVISSFSLTVNTLNELLLKTTNNIMFKLVDDDVIILDDNRVSIYPINLNVDEQTVFTMFSKSVVESLLSQGLELEISVEKRAEVLSITYENRTLEYGAPCPPYCT